MSEYQNPLDYLYCNIAINLTTKCWEWRGSFTGFGYGYFSSKYFKTEIDGTIKTVLMNGHRASWILHNGPISSRKILVCHKCDNPACCNPDHLFLGSSKDNTQDMVAKGRSSKGQKHGMCILTEQQVREARQLRQKGYPLKVLQKKYGISFGCIRKAVNGMSWKWLDEPIPTFKQPNIGRREYIFECD